MGLNLLPPVKTKMKSYIRYVDSLRVVERAGGGKKNKHVLTLSRSSCDDGNSSIGSRVR